MWKQFDDVRDLVPGQRVRVMNEVSGLDIRDWHVTDAKVREDGLVHIVPSRPFAPDYIWVRD